MQSADFFMQEGCLLLLNAVILLLKIRFTEALILLVKSILRRQSGVLPFIALTIYPRAEKWQIRLLGTSLLPLNAATALPVFHISLREDAKRSNTRVSSGETDISREERGFWCENKETFFTWIKSSGFWADKDSWRQNDAYLALSSSTNLFSARVLRLY